MPILKVAEGDYLNKDALEQVIHNYVFPRSLLTGGLSIDPIYAASQMHMVKDVTGQTDGRQLHHFILSFSDFESAKIDSANDLLYTAYRVCEYFSTEYQIVFGIHNNGKYHIHFVMNNISFVSGKRYSPNNSDYNNLALYIFGVGLPTPLKSRLHIKQLPVLYY